MSDQGEDLPTLREMVVTLLNKRGEPMTYRDLTNALWAHFPAYRDHTFTRNPKDKDARREVRTRLGGLVRNNPDLFTATKTTDNAVLVGLAATPQDVANEAEAEEEDDSEIAISSVYWYTFPAYQRIDAAHPIKIGHGKTPLDRINQQVTAMPEYPVILGTFEHENARILERALHAILSLRGKRISSPGAEWFQTTADEVRALINFVLQRS
jgi:hypothetical protein